MNDDYAQPDDLVPPSPALLDRVRDELGPWRNHSAVHAVIVDGDEGLVRVTFEVFTAIAAKCDLPEALWLGALRGCRVAVRHRPAPDDAIWAPTSLRVLDQRCRSVNASPSTPRSLRSSPLTMATSPVAPAPLTGTSGDPLPLAAGAHVTDDVGRAKVEPADAESMPPATMESHA
ncbi:hypothetical protein pdul_cds_931 [Pandoravirus dulcis]|uniref:Uncharacterized protein n=1 Tax=Pandoravirus dulcis TaxID=1349409 RepID=S4VYM7_9VIRU|nr:hypothetical protein pdul_cds_931 [Pandoravirus dulcis]AGO83176.2 hypothetical protein pdul_cds_931 [Pandoravirus dulcis]